MKSNNQYLLNNKSLWIRIKKYKGLYLLLIPSFLYLIVFKYVPIYGIQLAFKDYSFKLGILNSTWVGFDNFRYLLEEVEFWTAFKNTLIISFLKILIGFPIPVIIAILLNEVRSRKFQRISQTIMTFPHFLSWVVLSGIMFTFFANSGVVNNFRSLIGLEKISVLSNKNTFRWLLTFSYIWKEAGWSTIIYLAAISGIDPFLYEAAKIDGANRWHKIKHIVWPGIKAIVITMLILDVGRMMEAGFMQVLNLYNPAVYATGDILDTYVYRITFQKSVDFGISTAVSLFKGLTNCILLFTANRIANKFGEEGIS